MRRYQQKQLLELVKTLSEAHAEIGRLFSIKETQAMIGLLADCQDSAAQIGEFIEQLEGEGTKTVSELEDYCELLYQMSVAVNDSRDVSSLSGQLRDQLVKIGNSIEGELKPNRIEIVFLPYKASMWDSMESVWLAAKADPQCDAYVVPIPYYDRLPDGTLGQMHYEGGQYPAYVPVLDWQKYNIEERHPDVIVSHNPYDNWNHVTSLHPYFYHKRLKCLTDLLLYIPYFVCMDDVPERLCVCNAVLYADKVIVQSEKVRETYIREFQKMERENNCKGGFGDAESKFVALGSPKFDKVINTRRDDCSIPEQWRKLIWGTDGTRRKVILYNTSVASLLEGNVRVLLKLRCVLDFFRDRKDAVLLWRPHPLNEAAYESLRPQLANEYLNIVSEYKRQNIGIFDDTADLNRAIAISDAYYGDISSLVALYQCTGKPVMIQNSWICRDTDLGSPLLENLYDDGENFWFSAYNLNAFFKMDKQLWKAEYIGSFPGEEPNGKRLYSAITACNGKIYFAPGYANDIAEFDPENNTIKKIRLPDIFERTGIQPIAGIKFKEVVSYKSFLYFIGFTYPAIVRVDMTTGELDCFTDWLEPLDKLASDHGGYYFKSVCVVGSCIVMAALSANAVVMFDMETCSSKVYEVGNKKNLYYGICFDGSNYWLSPRYSGPIVKWNPETAFKEYDSFPHGFDGGGYSFFSILYSDGFIWLFPNRANMALKINIDTEQIAIAEEFQQVCGCNISGPNYIYSKVIDDVIYAFSGKTDRLIAYDCRTGHSREEAVIFSQKDMDAISLLCSRFLSKDIASCKSLNDCCYYENSNITLNNFLNYIIRNSEPEYAKMLYEKQIDIFREMNKHSDGTSGTAIFQYCRQTIIHPDKEGIR